MTSMGVPPQSSKPSHQHPFALSHSHWHRGVHVHPNQFMERWPLVSSDTCPGVQILSTRMHTCSGRISEGTTCDGESTMASWNSQQSPENAKHSGTSLKAQKEKMPLRGYALRGVLLTSHCGQDTKVGFLNSLPWL